MKTTLGAMLTLLLMATSIHAQVAPADAKRATRLVRLVEWAKHQGRDNAIAGDLAQPLGWGRGEQIRVRRKAVRDDTTRVIYGIDLISVESPAKYLTYRIVPGKKLLWKMDNRGTVEAVLIDTDSGKHLTNDPHLAALNETLSNLNCARQQDITGQTYHVTGTGDCAPDQSQKSHGTESGFGDEDK